MAPPKGNTCYPPLSRANGQRKPLLPFTAAPARIGKAHNPQHSWLHNSRGPKDFKDVLSMSILKPSRVDGYPLTE